MGATEQIVWTRAAGACFATNWCGEGCFDSRRRVNSTVGPHHMMKLFTAVSLLLVAGVVTACAQPQGESIAESHIRANVPDEKDFAKFLKRDLEQYFKDTVKKTVTVEYELLRNGPTQSGIAYPKFYTWVTVRDGKTVIDQGAVRVAAVEKKHFDVTDFVSEADIKDAPMVLDLIFPKPVADKIRERVFK